jgi:hypothetical protein
MLVPIQVFMMLGGAYCFVPPRTEAALSVNRVATVDATRGPFRFRCRALGKLAPQNCVANLLC